MRYILIVLFSCIITTVHAGGPWAEGKGKGFVEASFSTPIRTTTKDLSIQLYSEVGILEKLTFKAIIPLKIIGTPNDLDPRQFRQGTLFGISNVTLGLKYEFFKKKVLMSAGLDVELKTLAKNDDLGLRTGFQKYTFRPIYSIGYGIEKLYTYGEVKPGFSTNGFGHDLNLVAEIGGKVGEKVWISGYFEYRGVFKSGDFNDFDPDVYGNTGFYRDGQRFFTAGLKLSATLVKGFGISPAVFYGSSVSQSGGGGLFSAKIGVFYDW